MLRCVHTHTGPSQVSSPPAVPILSLSPAISGYRGSGRMDRNRRFREEEEKKAGEGEGQGRREQAVSSAQGLGEQFDPSSIWGS